jgi:MoaD family protein
MVQTAETFGRAGMAIVKLFGTLRDRAGKDQVTVPAGKTVRKILDLLSEEYGELVRRLLLEAKAGELIKRASVVIIINGHTQVDLSRVVDEEDVVAIFPTVAGG